MVTWPPSCGLVILSTLTPSISRQVNSISNPEILRNRQLEAQLLLVHQRVLNVLLFQFVVRLGVDILQLWSIPDIEFKTLAHQLPQLC